MATKAQLAVKVLQKLGVLAAGDTADSNDQTLVEEAYDSAYQYLRSLHLVSWGSSDDIPTYAVLPVRNYVASTIANDFGKQRSVEEERQSIIELAATLANDVDKEPTEAEYF